MYGSNIKMAMVVGLLVVGSSDLLAVEQDLLPTNDGRCWSCGSQKVTEAEPVQVAQRLVTGGYRWERHTSSTRSAKTPTRPTTSTARRVATPGYKWGQKSNSAAQQRGGWNAGNTARIQRSWGGAGGKYKINAK